MFKTLFGSAPSKEPSLLERLKAGVQKTRAGLMEKLEDAVSGRKEINELHVPVGVPIKLTMTDGKVSAIEAIEAKPK